MRLKVICLVIGVLSGLSACSTTEKSPSQPRVIKEQPQTQAPVVLNAEGLLNKARTAEGATRIQLLYTARENAITEQNWPILEQACLALERSESVDYVQNKLYIALARVEQNNYSTALSMLKTLKERLTLAEHKAWHQYLMGRIHASQGMPKKALTYYFPAADLSFSDNIEIAHLNDEIWQSLQQLSSYALERFDTGTVIQRGWVKLAKYQQIYIGSGIQLHQALNNWQRRFVNHPATYILPKKIQNAVNLAPYQAKHIAVLLPQTGSSKRLGSALKNGFLAAMDHSELEEITFIDEQLSLEDIERQLAVKPFDFIIGPLLKDNIEKVSTSSAIQSTPTLHLNNSDNPSYGSEQYFFALNPEHEVEQAMVHFLAQQYQKPMLLAPDTLSGLRLVNHFKNEWKKYSLIEPEIGLYTDSKDMARVVTNLLEVDASKERIKTIKSLFKKEVESETRSRMDIDVIYILGDAVETRLLKPYLDVNVSTFAERIPLYASSRSYSKRMDHTDKGDLEGLYFTEQPWMLNKSVDNFNLRTQYDALWPEQADIEQRLFAMAFDAVHLIPELKQLAKIPGKAYSGLTGRLSIKNNNIVERRLDWAQYKQKQIQLVQLNEQQPTPLFMQSHNRFQDNLRE